MIKLISTVGFIILNEENKILLIKQCKEKKAEEVENNGKIAVLKIKEEKENEAEEEWTIPFGNLEEDDDLRDIIKKKVKEYVELELIKNSIYRN
jgi:ADP-ribose pyrophosphatase YjhB (NUDIX family)